MRIIFANRYFHPDQSATSRMLSSLAFALARRGLKVVVVTSRDLHDDRKVVLPSNEMVSGVSIRRLGTTNCGRHNLIGRSIDYLLFHVVALFWLLTKVHEGDIAVVCTDPPLLSVTSAIGLRLKNATMVNWIMDLFPETAIELGYFAHRKRLARLAIAIRNWSLRTPGITVCPTEPMAHYIGLQGLAGKNILVLPHWADSNEIRPVERSANTLRRTWGLHESFVVGYSGNFGRAHEFGTMLGAAASLLPENDIRFLLVGSGHHHGAVTAVVAGHKLHNVLLRPLQQIGNLAESLSASDVHLVSLLPQLEHCIVPSKFYGILAAGRPTIFIGDADGEVARLIARSGCGMHVPIGAVDELAAAIRHLRDRPDIRVEMGEKARQLLLSEYSHEKAVDAWCSLFVRLQPAKLRATERVPS